MFNSDFWPTPMEVACQMLEAIDVKGKKILEPSAGSGNLVKALQAAGANVIACEIDTRLQKIVASMCPLIGDDFLKLSAIDISHIDAIVMNPPFSKGSTHIKHAWEIAPPGCQIVSLCNSATLENEYSWQRKELNKIIDDYGYAQSLGNCFSSAERATDVEVSMVFLKKPASNYEAEFQGFLMEEEPEEQAEGILPYNSIRDIVSRYINAIKLYDEQIQLGIKMNSLVAGIPISREGTRYDNDVYFLSFNEKEATEKRNRFKIALQKATWQSLFDKMDLNKYSTNGLKKDINKFVEQQKNIPFTMRNVYHMFAIVVGTASSRMDKALEEVFDKLTKYYADNRFLVEGWHTNSHYLVNRKFILPYVVGISYKGGPEINDYRSDSNAEALNDMCKALCFLTGKDYANYFTLSDLVRGYGKDERGERKPDLSPRPKWGEWFTWEPFFRVKCFKKGTIHAEFLSEDVWYLFNQNIARIKGYPLYEGKKPTPDTQQKSTDPARPRSVHPLGGHGGGIENQRFSESRTSQGSLFGEPAGIQRGVSGVL